MSSVEKVGRHVLSTWADWRRTAEKLDLYGYSSLAIQKVEASIPFRAAVMAATGLRLSTQEPTGSQASQV